MTQAHELDIDSILITGAAGNLGQKLIESVLQSDRIKHIYALDQKWSSKRDLPKVTYLTADLLSRPQNWWKQGLQSVDAIIHFAAVNPYPDATWQEAADSLEITANILEVAERLGTKRFVFASSNHVMGGYKGTNTGQSPGALKPDLEPLPGTHCVDEAGRKVMDSTAYATAKLMGERLCASKCHASQLTAVSVRIGWCQPGANRPETLSATGTPKEDAGSSDADIDLRWFRNMWLSNPDFCQIMQKAIFVDHRHWPSPAIIVNGVSNNTGTAWDLEPARNWLDYQPHDNVMG